MPLGPLGVTAVFVLLDWGAWEWATTANHPTLGLIAGLVMAPIAVAFAWSLARVIVALARIALRRAAPQARHHGVAAGGRGGGRGAPYDIEAEEERIAA